MFAAVGQQPFRGEATPGTPWSEPELARDLATFADRGLDLVALEDTAPMDRARLGLPGRDEEISQVITQIRAMGNLGIPVLCYNWMAITTWGRTVGDAAGRAGALVTGYRARDADAQPPLVAPGEVSEEQLWDALAYFLAAVVPEAEQSGVRLGMHPDDPPRAQHRGIPRIMRTPDAFRRLVQLHPSPSNGITFCQGNFSLMGSDLPALIDEFGGQGRIHFVHFRDVAGTADEFVETFHDDGQTDMVACMAAYARTGFSGPLRADHVPTLAGEDNDRPGYGVLGRLFAAGYIRGLLQATGLGTTAAPGRLVSCVAGAGAATHHRRTQPTPAHDHAPDDVPTVR